jgi:hypothetical protein
MVAISSSVVSIDDAVTPTACTDRASHAEATVRFRARGAVGFVEERAGFVKMNRVPLASVLRVLVGAGQALQTSHARRRLIEAPAR